MAEFYSDDDGEIDITPKYFIRECDDDEIEELINELVKQKKINENHPLVNDNQTFKDDEFNMCLMALSKNRITLTSNEENTIKSIGKKYLYL